MEDGLAARLDKIERTQLDVQNQLRDLQHELLTFRTESQRQFITMLDFLKQIKGDIAKSQKSIGTAEGMMHPPSGHSPVMQKGQCSNPRIGEHPSTIIRPQHIPEHSPHHFHQSSLPLQSQNLPPVRSAPIKVDVFSSKQAKEKSTRDWQNQKRQFTTIPISYGELYSQLLQNGLITPLSPRDRKTQDGKLPRNYDPKAHCEYHSGMEGHSIESCFALKETVQALIDMGFLNYGVNAHSGQSISKSRRERRNQRHQFTPIPSSYGELYPKLLQDNLIVPREAPVLIMQGDEAPEWYDSSAHCEYHGGVEGHSIERCIPIKKAVQELIDTGALKFE